MKWLVLCLLLFGGCVHKTPPNISINSEQALDTKTKKELEEAFKKYHMNSDTIDLSGSVS